MTQHGISNDLLQQLLLGCGLHSGLVLILCEEVSVVRGLVGHRCHIRKLSIVER